MRYDEASRTANEAQDETCGGAGMRTTPAADTLIVIPANAIRLVPDANGVIVLPAGVELDMIRVVGADLVILLPDGRVMVIENGAIVVPQLVIAGVEIPAANLSALLIGLEPEPAAGPPRSSGGNFAVPVGEIGPPVDLGDLLPPTDLFFTQPEFEEIYQAVEEDEEPGVIIVTPENPIGAVAASTNVSEAGLPARGDEPPGSNAAANSETTTGTIVITAGDPPIVVVISALSINGVEITTVGQTIVTPTGVLTITSIQPGQIGYSYTLTDNTSGNGTSDNFTVVITDADGQTAQATLAVNIADDAPTARADTDAVAAGSFVAETGNVFTGAGTTSGAAGADTPGADGASVTGAAQGSGTLVTVSGATVIAGLYGTLTINPDGSYSYVRAANTPGGVTDTFTYRLTDGDGDTSTATLSIAIGDSPPVITFIPDSGDGTIVFESGLPARDGESAGSDAPAPSEVTSGTITFEAIDGPATVSINGVEITMVGQTIETETGILTITSIGSGSIGYEFELTDNTDGNNSSQDITVTVTDSDGDSDTGILTIDIIDDVPTAEDDADSISEDAVAPATGNVLANDTQGADGADVTSVAFGETQAGTGESLAGDYGSIIVNADGGYSYTLDNTNTAVQGLSAGETLTETFTYTITDGDGDPSTATLTITINGADDGVVINGLGAEGGEETVDEDDLADGSSPDAGALTQSGSFTFDAPDGLGSVSINGTVITFGSLPQSVTSATGTLTITGFTPVIGADGSTIGGTIDYEYTLDDNTLTHDESGQDNVTDSFAVTVTDSDGSSDTASLDITIIDDVPDAIDDMAREVAEDAVGTIGGNVLTNDVQGADGATLTSVTIGGVVTAVAAVGTTNVVTAKGAYTFTAAGDWTFDPAPNQDNAGGTDASFTYTITDGDGDMDSAVQPITVTDGAGPVAGEPVTLTVDDQNLADGSTPAGPDFDSGSITFTAGSDDIASIVFGTDLSGLGGGLTWERVSDTEIVGRDGTNTIITLTLGVVGNVATVTATLNDNYDSHPGINVDDLQDLGSIGVVATDIDGDPATGTVNVQVSDDLPTANDDSVLQPTEGQAFTIDAFDNDVFGADGVDIDNDPAVKVTFTQPAQGTVTYDPATGLFTYTPGEGAGSITTDDSFTYTITDADGDQSTATVNVTLAGDSEPEVVSAAGVTVDEDGFAFANADSEPLQTDPAETDSTESLTGTGTAVVDFGADVPADLMGSIVLVDTLALDGQLETLAGESVTFELEPGTGDLVGKAGATEVIRISITNAVAGPNAGEVTYTYSVTLSQPVKHSDDQSENSEILSGVTFQVTDSDGDPVTGTFDVTIIDDVPTAEDDADSVTEDTDLVATGNVITNDAPGADGGEVTTVVSVGSGDSDTATPGGTAITGQYGTLTIHSDGSYSYALDNTNAAVQALSDGDTLTDTFTYDLTDGDGDSEPADLVITINGSNDTPSVSVPQPGADGTSVDEAGLPARMGEPEGSDEPANSETTTGTITFTNGDGASTVTINGVTVAVNATVPGDYGTLTITSYDPVNGTIGYSYTLADNVDHDADLTPFESFTVTVSDSDGNPADDASDTFQIQIVDDVPDAIDDMAREVAEDAVGTIGGNVLTNDVQGADGATLTSVTIGGVVTAVAAVGTTNVVTAKGAYTFTAAGDWTFDPAPNQDNESGIDASFTYTITDGDGDMDSAVQPITVTDGAGPGSGGTVSLTVAEAALDTALTGDDDTNDIAPGSVTGTNPNSLGETDFNASGLNFLAGSDNIVSVAFGTMQMPTVSGLAPNYSIQWAMDGSILVGSLYFDADGMGGADPVLVGEAIRLELSGETGTTAAGDTATVGVKATLTGALEHANPPAVQGPVTINGLIVVAEDADGDTSTGSINVTVTDDTPVLTFVEDIDIPNQIGESYGDITFDYGADGAGSITLTPLTDIEGLTWEGSGTGMITAVVNGTDYFTVTVDQTTGEYVVDVLTTRPVVETPLAISNVAPGNYTTITVNGATFDGGSFADGTTLASQFTNDGSTINPSGNGFGIANNLVNDNEGFLFTNPDSTALTFDIVFQPNTDSVIVSYAYWDGSMWVDVSYGTVNAGPDDRATVTLDPPGDVTFDQIIVRFDYSGNGAARVENFVVTEQLIPDNQLFQFDVTVTDGDGDVVSSGDQLELTFLGGAPMMTMLTTFSKESEFQNSNQTLTNSLVAASMVGVIGAAETQSFAKESDTSESNLASTDGLEGGAGTEPLATVPEGETREAANETETSESYDGAMKSGSLSHDGEPQDNGGKPENVNVSDLLPDSAPDAAQPMAADGLLDMSAMPSIPAEAALLAAALGGGGGSEAELAAVLSDALANGAPGQADIPALLEAVSPATGQGPAGVGAATDMGQAGDAFILAGAHAAFDLSHSFDFTAAIANDAASAVSNG